MERIPARDIGVEETLAFVRARLGDRRVELLEVGCGDGRVAARLVAAGHRVRAIDLDPASVARARAHGVDASVADIAGYRREPVDLVLFARSLHHLDRPVAGLESARALVRPGGWLLAEEFGHDLVTPAAAAWVDDVGRLLRIVAAGGAGDARAGGFAGDPMAGWRREHPAGHLRTSAELRDAVAAVLPGAEEESAPYLYRYLVEEAAALADGGRVARGLLAWERALISRGQLPAVGLRWSWWNGPG